MVNAGQIQEHMEVVGSDGEHVGTVDKIEGQQIKLTKSDPASGGEHQYLDLGLVEGVMDGKVQLSLSAEDAKDELMVEEPGDDDLGRM